MSQIANKFAFPFQDVFYAPFQPVFDGLPELGEFGKTCFASFSNHTQVIRLGQQFWVVSILQNNFVSIKCQGLKFNICFNETFNVTSYMFSIEYNQPLQSVYRTISIDNNNKANMIFNGIPTNTQDVTCIAVKNNVLLRNVFLYSYGLTENLGNHYYLVSGNLKKNPSHDYLTIIGQNQSRQEFFSKLEGKITITEHCPFNGNIKHDMYIDAENKNKIVANGAGDNNNTQFNIVGLNKIDLSESKLNPNQLKNSCNDLYLYYKFPTLDVQQFFASGKIYRRYFLDNNLIVDPIKYFDQVKNTTTTLFTSAQVPEIVSLISSYL